MTNNAIGTSVEYPVISDGRKREGRGERGEPGEEVGTIKLRRRRQDHLKFCTHNTDDAAGCCYGQLFEMVILPDRWAWSRLIKRPDILHSVQGLSLDIEISSRLSCFFTASGARGWVVSRTSTLVYSISKCHVSARFHAYDA